MSYSFFGKAVLGLVQAFCFNWLYFEIGTALTQASFFIWFLSR